MIMTDLYFTCGWVIRPAVNYVRLVGIARELGCALAIAEAYAVTPERMVITRFALHAPTQASFDQFIDKVGGSIGLNDWQPTTAETFIKAQPLDLHLLDSDFIVKWIDGMHTYGLHNQALLDEGEEQS